MAKRMLHKEAARAALGRGAAKLAMAVEGTLGPKGMNTIIDRPIGTPMISRDGVSIAHEVELEDRFENMGAQVVREVSMQTNEIAGDGTTTATVLANAIIQAGIDVLKDNAYPIVDVVDGLEQAASHAMTSLQQAAVSIKDENELQAVATIAATDATLGSLVAEAIHRVGSEGTVTVDYGLTVDTTLEVTEGMSFDRGYISHHMVTNVEKMQAILEQAHILLTDQKIRSLDALANIRAEVAKTDRPLLIIADELAPEVLVDLLSREGKGKIAAIHPPEYGHWRKAMLEDLAILTGGRVIARDLGGRLEDVTLDDLGSAERIQIDAHDTVISGGGGDPKEIQARRTQVIGLHYESQPNIEKDKLAERLARLSGGTAVILAGGATPVEQKRRVQLIEDSLNATRAAAEQGIVPGGGAALTQTAAKLDDMINASEGGVREGIRLLQSVLDMPLRRIASNCGRDPEEIAANVAKLPWGEGFNGRNGNFESLLNAGVIDPVKVTCTALQNAVSVACLILTTQTLIADIPEDEDPTAGPAMGGGAELL